jgi:hypothetical protein
MKSKLFILLLTSLFVASLGGAVCLYWGFKFHTQANDETAKFSILESKFQLIECPSLNKDAVLTIERNSIERRQEFGNLLQIISIFFFTIGVVNLGLVSACRKLPL